MEKTDEYFMSLALNESKKCKKFCDVPVGAVVVKEGKVISTGYNKKEKQRSAVAHAEIVAIHKASRKLKNFRLDDCVVYVTKEPCLMCMGALLSARVKKIVFGAYDRKYPTHQLATNNNFNHKCEIVGGVMQVECESMLSTFFEDLRKSKKEN